jgi:uncharacterized protein
MQGAAVIPVGCIIIKERSIMKRDEALKILHDHQAEITTYGVRKLALFGSVARNEAHLNSDVDLLVEFEHPTGLFTLFTLQNRLEEILGCPVDLGTPDGLKQRFRAQILKECIDVA